MDFVAVARKAPRRQDRTTAQASAGWQRTAGRDSRDGAGSMYRQHTPVTAMRSSSSGPQHFAGAHHIERDDEAVRYDREDSSVDRNIAFASSNARQNVDRTGAWVAAAEAEEREETQGQRYARSDRSVPYQSGRVTKRFPSPLNYVPGGYLEGERRRAERDRQNADMRDAGWLPRHERRPHSRGGRWENRG